MSKISHENIVSLVGVVGNPLCMLLEFCSDGNLFEWLHVPERMNIEINKEQFFEREKFALDIAKGMSYLHSTNPPIIHRDLKSPNVLLTKEKKSKYLTAKIADFGLSRGLVWSKNLTGKAVDNPIWLAPEILNNELYNEKVDVYAFGVMLWELISGKDFFGDVGFMSKVEDMIKKGQREIIPENNPNIPEYYIQLLTDSWHQDPDKRPSFKFCVEQIEKNDFLLNSDENEFFNNEMNNNNTQTESDGNGFVKCKPPPNRKRSTFTLGTSKKKNKD